MTTPRATPGTTKRPRAPTRRHATGAPLITRAFPAPDQKYITPTKSVFRYIVGDSGLELDFAAWLDKAPDVVSFTKNFTSVGFRIDYVNADGVIATYLPDFVVSLGGKRRVVVETKGLEDFDVPRKMARLRQWCPDANAAQTDTVWEHVFVDQAGWEKYRPATFAQLLAAFREYKGEG